MNGAPLLLHHAGSSLGLGLSLALLLRQRLVVGRIPEEAALQVRGLVGQLGVQQLGLQGHAVTSLLHLQLSALLLQILQGQLIQKQ